jgi:hypothetical protein
MIFLKHVQYRLNDQHELQSLLAHVRKTAAKAAGVRLRDFFILLERDEFILVVDCPDQATYQKWRDLCPPPPEAKDWIELAVLPEDFQKNAK